MDRNCEIYKATNGLETSLWGGSSSTKKDHILSKSELLSV